MLCSLQKFMSKIGGCLTAYFAHCDVIFKSPPDEFNLIEFSSKIQCKENDKEICKYRGKPSLFLINS